MIRSLLVALLVLFSAHSAAQVMRAEDGQGSYLRLFSQPCANDRVLARTPPAHRQSLHAGEAKVNGTVYGMCWLALPDGTVGILYEDGDQGRMPIQAFRPEVGA